MTKGKHGVTDKKGRQPCNAKLSILMNLTCKDSAEFVTFFGANTVTGLKYDPTTRSKAILARLMESYIDTGNGQESNVRIFL